MPNIVYVLTNPAMPDIVKIGMTDQNDVQDRMRQLYSTGVPLPFECVIARRIEDRKASEIESALHTAFGPNRVNSSREFFQIDPEQVEVLLRVMPGEDVTPSSSEQEAGIDVEDREAASSYKRNRVRTNEQEFIESLNEYGIPVYERLLALGKQEGMQVRWGRRGFSLRVLSNGKRIPIGSGYPPAAYNQSFYTDLGSVIRNSNVPADVVEALRAEARDTPPFVTVGRNNELACRTDRHLEESEISALTEWLSRVIAKIRKYEGVVNDDG